MICNTCNVTFKRKSNYNRHLLSSFHVENEKNGITHAKSYLCPCGRTYSTNQSLCRHKKTCTYRPQSAIEKIELLENTVLEQQQNYQQEREQHQKERDELRAQIAILMDKHACTNTTNNNNIETNIETQNNTINIHINAFGQENIDHIDDKTIKACIERVYKSVPAILEKIHFDPNHPENHNIKITNKKLPYASVMGDNRKWKTVDRKDAIETMVFNGYNLLDEKYPETKMELSERKQEHFEGFQNRFEEEDKDLRKQLKTDVELLVLNSLV